ncbi:hypothetical protein [Dictyobacter kobayashii]|uniref:HAMP domain-containing protein n=1 Tax=Dictyobacter kobayashii TaxID=2014872 RepID=A0A402AE13_9CHLR|nr:hypothetical protein [Dictyobacter kobayashii]GCE17324.1 hypothetical protein KDK_11240 [Dictyobacter kobayashii]
MQGNFDRSIVQQDVGFWRRIANWWYGISTPPEPGGAAPYEEREVIRRSRLASIIILIVFIGNFPSLPAAIIGPNKILLPILGIQLIATIVAFFLNKRGHVNWAGALVVFFLAIGMMANVATNPGGITVQVVPLFAILVIPEILAAAMLPAYWVFIMALINIVFSFYAITYMHAPNLSQQDLQFAYSNGGALTATVQVIVAGVSFLWNLSLGRALREKDQAEEIARLESDLSEQSMQIMREKEQLEQSIELIIQTQSRVANGDLNARVPLTQDNVLWSVGGALNNMISRLQRTRATEKELEVTRNSAATLINLIRARKAGMPGPQYNRTGTVIDAITMEVFSPNEQRRAIDEQSAQKNY